MAGNTCRCGGTYIRSHEDSENSFVWACNSCGRSFIKRRPRKVKQPSQTQRFSSLEIGRGVIRFIEQLETSLENCLEKISELERCVSDRDQLQKQLYELQERHNKEVIEKSTEIPKNLMR